MDFPAPSPEGGDLGPPQRQRDDVPGSQNITTSNLPDTTGYSLPSVALPSGGGAIAGMGEKFNMNALTGSGSFSIPIPTSPSRNHAFCPSLSLRYSTGDGNGAFGLGWVLDGGTAEIVRKTALGMPRYQDGGGVEDVFLLGGGEDLVPVEAAGVEPAEWMVKGYRPRVEGAFLRIERWTNQVDKQNVHWRVISTKNETTILGRDDNSRIFDLDASTGTKRIFSWLVCERYDRFGNAELYSYKPEDSTNVNASLVHEQNRNADTRKRQLYLKTIKYGNGTPNRNLSNWTVLSAEGITDWMFEVVLDYGDHDLLDPTPNDQGLWSCRQDPFSSCISGFEVRTYRLCRRILIFHHFPDDRDLGRIDYLVRATDLVYAEDAAISFLTSVTHAGFVLRGALDPPATGTDPGPYVSKHLPSLQFEYSPVLRQDQIQQLTVRTVNEASMENLPAGVAGGYRWMDLRGEGLTGVFSEQAGEWYYKPNLSASNILTTDAGADVRIAKLGSMERVGSRPIRGSTEPQFVDLQGDGALDLLVTQGPVKGFFKNERDGSGGVWLPFQPFAAFPNIDMDDPNLRLVDLTGDGLADILITNDDVLTWYESLGEQGYAQPQRVWQALDEEKGPRLLFADQAESIHIADLSGDGLLDLCRIRNMNICYWPNLGYGRFGARVVMDNSPTFDRMDSFSQKRILLGDVDGSGTTDILYLGNDAVDIYLNQSGNSFSAHLKIEGLLPHVDSLMSVSFLDLLGTGTMCLLWSSSGPGGSRSSLRYVDLMDGVKPHLLTKTTNGLGMETKFSYVPSTDSYLRDQQAGHPWATKLPYPVHCIERVETYDLVGRTLLVQRFCYHHGYFDGVEREFRGFGMVEQWDTENFETLQARSPGNATNVNSSHHSPPVYTKTWFHTGAFRDYEKLTRLYAREYFGGEALSDTELETFLDQTLRDVLPPEAANFTNNEAREASRTLKGSLLRQETYGLDGTVKTPRPYRIINSGSSVRLLQRQGQNPHPVFYAYQRENMTIDYEREIEDPHSKHELILAKDDYGNTLQQLAVLYGRHPPKIPLPNPPSDGLSDADRAIQETLSMCYHEADFTKPLLGNSLLGNLDYFTPQVSGNRSYELTGFLPSASLGQFTMADFSAGHHDPTAIEEIAYDAVPAPNIDQKRLLKAAVTVYRSDDLARLLPKGEIQSIGLPGQAYILCQIPSLLSVYQRDGVDLSPNLAAVAKIDGGYIDLNNDGNLWSSTPIPQYGSASGDVLTAARKTFFLPQRVQDLFGKITTYEYDVHLLVSTGSIDQLGNVISSTLDYRTVNPQTLTDINGDRSSVAFDALGMVVGSAVAGKIGGPVEGDSLDGFKENITQDEIDQFYADPRGMSQALLGNATRRHIYDLSLFSKDPANLSPVFSSTLRREIHSTEASAGPLRIQISFTYSDGFGRSIQNKVSAAPSPSTPTTPRWTCSGWIIYNNKNNPVQQFEPFFDGSHRFQRDIRVGVSSISMYDPLSRCIGMLFPNHTWTKTQFASWSRQDYDTNDTVLMDAASDSDVGPYFQALDKASYLLSYFDARKTGALGPNEQDAALKAKDHANTPRRVHFNTLDQPFLSIADNGGEDLRRNHRVFDIQGNSLEVRDALDRVVQRSQFDMLDRALHTSTMDAGEHWIFYAADGKVMFTWDGKGRQFQTAYDVLRRVVGVTMIDELGVSRRVNKMVYGESESDGSQRNLRGRVSKFFDQAGLLTNLQFDFKGNLTADKRQLANDYKEVLDWSEEEAAVELEDEEYIFSRTYDALNRVTTQTTPKDSVMHNVYNEVGFLSSASASLFGGSSAVETPFIVDIQYDAYGRPIETTRGNGSRTTDTYDPLTKRLANRRTVRNTDAVVLQDTSYTYDPVGSITTMLNNAVQDIFFRNNVVSPNATYTYDALYHLTLATGREHLGQTNGAAPTPTAAAPAGTPVTSPADGKAFAAYQESYTYDVVGNILSLRHQISDSQHPGWTRKYTCATPSRLDPNTPSNRLTSTTVGTAIENYSCDSNGNITAMPHLSLITWDFHEQLRSLATQVVTNGDVPETTWYVYDYSGKRVRKVTERQRAVSEAPRRLAERISIGGFEVFKKYNGNGETVKMQCDTLHVGGGANRFALVERWTDNTNNVPTITLLHRYQLFSRLHTISLELSDDSAVLSYEEFTPYGSTSYQLALTQAPKRYRFAGKERDGESGLDYFGRRFYASWLGRWMSPDPAGLRDGWNVFVYAGGNPVGFEDKDGCVKRRSEASNQGGGDQGRAKFGRASSGSGDESTEGDTTETDEESDDGADGGARVGGAGIGGAGVGAGGDTTQTDDESSGGDTTETDESEHGGSASSISSSSSSSSSTAPSTAPSSRSPSPPPPTLEDLYAVDLTGEEQDHADRLTAALNESGPAVERHHLFPQEYSAEFWQMGINVHNFIIVLPSQAHGFQTSGTEESQSSWNRRWRDIVYEIINDRADRDVPEAGEGDRARETLKELMVEYGLGGARQYFIRAHPFNAADKLTKVDMSKWAHLVYNPPEWRDSQGYQRNSPVDHYINHPQAFARPNFLTIFHATFGGRVV